MQLIPTIKDFKLQNKVFKIDIAYLESEMKLYKGFDDIPRRSFTTTIDQWVNWLQY